MRIDFAPIFTSSAVRTVRFACLAAAVDSSSTSLAYLCMNSIPCEMTFCSTSVTPCGERARAYAYFGQSNAFERDRTREKTNVFVKAVAFAFARDRDARTISRRMFRTTTASLGTNAPGTRSSPASTPICSSSSRDSSPSPSPASSSSPFPSSSPSFSVPVPVPVVPVVVVAVAFAALVVVVVVALVVVFPAGFVGFVDALPARFAAMTIRAREGMMKDE